MPVRLAYRMDERDLDAILEVAGDDLRTFRGAHLLVTGGTGFVGTWMLSAVAHANRRAAADIWLDVLTRDPQSFARREPELAAANRFRMVSGDICDPLPDVRYDGIIQ